MTLPYSVAVNASQLRRQMQVRGLTGVALASLAGLSPSTVSSALNGRRIHPRKLRAIVAALAKMDPLPGMEELAEVAR